VRSFSLAARGFRPTAQPAVILQTLFGASAVDDFSQDDQRTEAALGLVGYWSVGRAEDESRSRAASVPAPIIACERPRLLDAPARWRTEPATGGAAPGLVARPCAVAVMSKNTLSSAPCSL